MCFQGKIQQRYTAHWQRPLPCLEESWLLWISCLFNQGGKVSAPEVEYICIKIFLPWLDPPVSDSSESSLLKLYRCEQNQWCVDFSTLVHIIKNLVHAEVLHYGCKKQFFFNLPSYANYIINITLKNITLHNKTLHPTAYCRNNIWHKINTEQNFTNHNKITKQNFT